MSNEKTHQTESRLEEVAQNAGARTAATNSDPTIALEEARNANAGEGPTGSGGSAPSTVEEHIPSTSDPFATDIPSANAPDPQAANPETNPNAASLSSDQDES